MDNKKRVMVLFWLILFGWCLNSVNVLSWNSHYFLTELTIMNNQWINDLPEVQVTPYDYKQIDPSEYNPGFVVKYIQEEIGGKTKARDILINYSDEPDWDLDTNLDLNKIQSLTGGSQGYRHMYFSIGGGILQVGEAPQRAEHFWEMAKMAFDKGDDYWGFRFFSRAIHYLEDLSQPYHTYPAPVEILVQKLFNIKKLTVLVTNAHYGYEDFNGYLFNHKREEFLALLPQVSTIKIDSVEEAAIEISRQARKDFDSSFQETLKLFPVLNNDERLITLTREEIIRIANLKESAKLVSLMKEDILLGLDYLNGFLNLLKEYLVSKNKLFLVVEENWLKI